VTSSLPQEIQEVFDRFITTEYTTVDRRGQPITWPLTPYYRPGDSCIDVTTGLGYPKKARDAERNPKVALLFSDPTGSGIENPPMVLVQGTADVDDRDLEANRRRYETEALEKLPGAKEMSPPDFLKRFFAWYYTRIYVHVRPERVYTWPGCDVTREPELWDAHMEEVRSGHDEEPESEQASPEGGSVAWDPRVDELGARHATAVLSFVAPNGNPSGPTRRSARSGSRPSRWASRWRPASPASPLTTTTSASPTSATSRCAAISSSTAAAGRYAPTSSSAASSSHPARSPSG